MTYSNAARWDNLSSSEFYRLDQWEMSRIVAEYIIHNRQQEIELFEAKQATAEGVENAS